jgi:hypothetical protein
LRSQAGCDSLDSDGDGQVDNCEDKYPPELVVRNVEAFRCGNLYTDASRSCYTAVVFKDEEEVETFLRGNFVVIDDCPLTKLGIEIKKLKAQHARTLVTLSNLSRIQAVPRVLGVNTTSLISILWMGQRKKS